ncbi:unnamed protein product [Calypogeia fissa]
MAASGPALWACYAVALLVLFVAKANCTVWYSSASWSNSQGAYFTANLDDNDLQGVCSLPEGTPWVGQGNDQALDCGNSGYTAVASFGVADYYGFIQCAVTMTRPGFSGDFGTDFCYTGCSCDSVEGNLCVTWTGQSW